MTETVILPKLVVKSLGNPRVAASFSDDDKKAGKRHLLGTIMGTASRIKNKVDAKGEVFEAIVGDFEGTKADGNVVKSGLLYLPSGIHEMLADPLKEDDAKPIDFAMRIFTVPADNPIGYSYLVEPVLPPSAADPLAHIREAMGKQIALLDAPKEEPKKGKAA